MRPEVIWSQAAGPVAGFSWGLGLFTRPGDHGGRGTKGAMDTPGHEAHIENGDKHGGYPEDEVGHIFWTAPEKPGKSPCIGEQVVGKGFIGKNIVGITKTRIAHEDAEKLDPAAL